MDAKECGSAAINQRNRIGGEMHPIPYHGKANALATAVTRKSLDDLTFPSMLLDAFPSHIIAAGFRSQEMDFDPKQIFRKLINLLVYCSASSLTIGRSQILVISNAHFLLISTNPLVNVQ